MTLLESLRDPGSLEPGSHCLLPFSGESDTGPEAGGKTRGGFRRRGHGLGVPDHHRGQDKTSGSWGADLKVCSTHSTAFPELQAPDSTCGWGFGAVSSSSSQSEGRGGYLTLSTTRAPSMDRARIPGTLRPGLEIAPKISTVQRAQPCHMPPSAWRWWGWTPFWRAWT